MQWPQTQDRKEHLRGQGARARTQPQLLYHRVFRIAAARQTCRPRPHQSPVKANAPTPVPTHVQHPLDLGPRNDTGQGPPALKKKLRARAKRLASMCACMCVRARLRACVRACVPSCSVGIWAHLCAPACMHARVHALVQRRSLDAFSIWLHTIPRQRTQKSNKHI